MGYTNTEKTGCSEQLPTLHFTRHTSPFIVKDDVVSSSLSVNVITECHVFGSGVGVDIGLRPVFSSIPIISPVATLTYTFSNLFEEYHWTIQVFSPLYPLKLET
jgi:hypothetical protein